MRGLPQKLASFRLIAVLTSACFAASGPPLAQKYEDWLKGPTSYLITKPEREAFSRLRTDAERDAFIERFWEIRNPASGSGRNEFKEEFYRRVAFANAFYGRDAGSEGWRTDRGRTYILFGRPQSSMNYLGHQELRPIELWFYSNPGLPELPAFFYVLFYDKDDTGYRLYHPYVDGPDKLLKAGGTKAQAYHYLRQISPELARASLTLIPGEPIDTETFTGSIGSAQILNAVQGYRDMPSYAAAISAKSQRLERITSRIEFDVAQCSVHTLVTHHGGEPWVDWHLEIRDPMRPKANAGRVEYKITARLYSNNKLVFERSDSPAFTVPEQAQEALKRRPFVYEDRMPVAPGKYRLVVTARNTTAGRTYEASREFTVAQPGDPIVLSELVVVARHEPDRRERPFQFGGVKFLPSASAQVTAIRGLRVLYQVTVREPKPEDLEVEYVVGSLTAKLRKTFEEKLDLRRTDALGSVVTAKTLSIEDLAPGSYQLALRIKDPRSGRITGGSTSFVVVNTEEQAEPIVISRTAGQAPQFLAANHYERALCWLAQGRPREALASLESSWKINQNPATAAILQQLYERTGQGNKQPESAGTKRDKENSK